MFTNFDDLDETKKNIKADVIILGCSLPGIVAAYKLKASLGDTVEIVVLDLALPQPSSRCDTIGFQDDMSLEEFPMATQAVHTKGAQQFIISYSKEFNIPVPDNVILPGEDQIALVKVFQDNEGNTIQCYKDFHEFEYLGFLERFELSQYHNRLEQKMQDLFHTKVNDFFEQSKLRSYDQTSMEKHLRSHLLFSASREIMSLTVRLVCGAPASEVSLLFYLHQCYRNASVRNNLDGDNLKFREKILGYCRKRLYKKLQQSIADITMKTKCIAEIRTNSKEQVILETLNKETSYVCKLLAMAIPPDILENIRVEAKLLSTEEADAAQNMQSTRALKFVVKYENNFWRPLGFSGEIFSIKGPIIWAMEKPNFTNSGYPRTPTSLVGFLEADFTHVNSKQAVLQQLVKLFGSEAASPLSYLETDMRDIFVPKCGDYVTLIKMTSKARKFLVWGALDVYADGDLSAALEAGHNAYLSVLRWFRPQAIDYDDAQLVERPVMLTQDPVTRFVCGTSLMTGIYILAASSATVACIGLIRYLRK